MSYRVVRGTEPLSPANQTRSLDEAIAHAINHSLADQPAHVAIWNDDRFVIAVYQCGKAIFSDEKNERVREKVLSATVKHDEETIEFDEESIDPATVNVLQLLTAMEAGTPYLPGDPELEDEADRVAHEHDQMVADAEVAASESYEYYYDAYWAGRFTEGLSDAGDNNLDSLE